MSSSIEFDFFLIHYQYCHDLLFIDEDMLELLLKDDNIDEYSLEGFA